MADDKKKKDTLTPLKKTYKRTEYDAKYKGNAIYMGLEGLAPDTRARVAYFQKVANKALADKGYDVRVGTGETWRSADRQAYIAEEGRTRPGKTRTWTLNSQHMGDGYGTGKAFDIRFQYGDKGFNAPKVPTTKKDWDIFNTVADAAEQAGIEWGHRYGNRINSDNMRTDYAHFQVMDPKYMKKRGIDRVFKEPVEEPKINPLMASSLNPVPGNVPTPDEQIRDMAAKTLFAPPQDNPIPQKGTVMPYEVTQEQALPPLKEMPSNDVVGLSAPPPPSYGGVPTDTQDIMAGQQSSDNAIYTPPPPSNNGNGLFPATPQEMFAGTNPDKKLYYTPQ